MTSDDILLLSLAGWLFFVGGGGLLYFYLAGKKLDRELAEIDRTEKSTASRFS